MRISRIERELQKLRFEQPAGYKQRFRALMKKAQASGRYPWLMSKRWQQHSERHEVDFELKDDWLRDLNEFAAMSGGELTSVCAGHPFWISNFGYSQREPHFRVRCYNWEKAIAVAPTFSLPDTRVSVEILRRGKEGPGYRPLYYVQVDSFICHNGTNQEILGAWWKHILERFQIHAEAAVKSDPFHRLLHGQDTH